MPNILWYRDVFLFSVVSLYIKYIWVSDNMSCNLNRLWKYPSLVATSSQRLLHIFFLF